MSRLCESAVERLRIAYLDESKLQTTRRRKGLDKHAMSAIPIVMHELASEGT